MALTDLSVKHRCQTLKKHVADELRAGSLVLGRKKKTSEVCDGFSVAGCLIGSLQY